MIVANEDLTRWAGLTARLKNLVFQAQRAGADQRNTLLEEAGHLAANLQTRLDRAGAEAPQSVPASRYETPIHLLDTPANRRYMELLHDAWQAGLAVDRERYGESIGTDGCAQVIEMVLRDVQQEVLGPVGTIKE